METRPAPWIDAVRHSHETLSQLARPLTVDQLRSPSFDSEWTIAQVLSHLGSQAEIFSLFLDAGLSGADAPGRDQFLPIWATWDAKDPEAQRADSHAANLAVVQQLEALNDEERSRFRLQMFGMDLDTTGVARMRLGEHALHTWDVAVALDETATVQSDAVQLLVDVLDQLVPRVGKNDGVARQVAIVTNDPERQFVLETGESIALTTGPGQDSGASLSLSGEAFLRLVYGRLAPEHEPINEVVGVELEELRALFPGF